MLEARTQAPSLIAFIFPRQWITLGALTEAVQYLSAPLLRKYADKGIPVHTGPAWPHQALKGAIAKGPHTSTCTPKMAAFVHGELRQCV